MRHFILSLIAALSLSACSSADDQPVGAAQDVALTVYKSPTCGCCEDWVNYAEDAGFVATIEHPENLNEVKQALGLQPRYGSCHTAVTEEGYIFEGHIPVKTIRKFLADPPQDALGLAVPGMPLGSPGMEVDDRFTPYAVLLLKRDGSAEEYAKFETAAEQY